MPRTIRFHLDEHIDPAIAIGLRRRGIDVTTTPEAGLRGHSDESQLAYCLSSERVMFTSDKDFLKLHSLHSNHPGIAYSHQHRMTIGSAIRGLVQIWEILEPNEMKGRIEYLPT